MNTYKKIGFTLAEVLITLGIIGYSCYNYTDFNSKMYKPCG